MVVQGHVAHERLLQIFTTGESVCLEHIGNAPIEALDHAVGARRAWFGQAVFNVQLQPIRPREPLKNGST